MSHFRTVRLLVCIAALVACDSASKKEAKGKTKSQPPVPVETYRVEAKPFTRTIEAVGSLRSPESTQITSEISGKVVYLDVPEGTRVKKGHVFAKLDASTSRAELAVARARLEGARDTLERSRALGKEKLLAEQAVDEAEAQQEVAAGEVARQSAALSKTLIRAPFAGVVGLKEVSLGAFLSPGDPITTIASLDTLELVFSVPERYVPSVSEGQKVRGVVGACTHRFTAKIAVIEPAVDPRSRTLRMLARVDNAAGLKPGMSATVRVEVGEVDKAMAIPQEALIRRGTKTMVYIVTPDGTAKTKDVSVGEVNPREVEITGGLEVGTTVIASGHQKVRPGAKVAPKPYEPIDNPNLKLGVPSAKADCWF